MDYLQASGVLDKGTSEDIKAAKDKYWAHVRKEYKKQKRQNNKSYTIFYSPAEVTILSKAKDAKESITAFIRQAALTNANNSVSLSKRIIGEMRGLLFGLYNISINSEMPTSIRNEFIKHVQAMEQKLIRLKNGE